MLSIPEFLFVLSIVCGLPFTCTFNFVDPTAIQFNRSLKNTPYPFETCIIKPSQSLVCIAVRRIKNEADTPAE